MLLPLSKEEFGLLISFDTSSMVLIGKTRVSSWVVTKGSIVSVEISFHPEGRLKDEPSEKSSSLASLELLLVSWSFSLKDLIILALGNAPPR